MCRPVTCKTCGKTTWAGSGQHDNQVMAPDPRAAPSPGHATEPAQAGSVLGRLFGRS